GDKIVSIVSRAADGDKQLASTHSARINRDAGQPRHGGEPRGNCDTQSASNLLNRPPHIVLSGLALTAFVSFLNRHNRARAKCGEPLPGRRIQSCDLSTPEWSHVLCRRAERCRQGGPARAPVRWRVRGPARPALWPKCAASPPARH